MFCVLQQMSKYTKNHGSPALHCWDRVTELEEEDVLGLGQSLRYHCELVALVDVNM